MRKLLCFIAGITLLFGCGDSANNSEWIGIWEIVTYAGLSPTSHELVFGEAPQLPVDIKVDWLWIFYDDGVWNSTLNITASSLGVTASTSGTLDGTYSIDDDQYTLSIHKATGKLKSLRYIQHTGTWHRQQDTLRLTNQAKQIFVFIKQ